MILLRRVLSLCAPLVLFGFLVLLQEKPHYWPWAGLGLGLTLSLSIAYMLPRGFHRGHFWMTLFPLCSLAVGTVGLLFFLTSSVARWAILLLFPLMVGVYLETLFTKHFQEQKYTQLSLPMVSFVLNIVGAFTLFAFLFGLHLIDVLPTWILVVVGLLFGMLHMAHQLWSYQVWNRHGVVVAIIVGALSAEVVWVLHFWPTAFFVNGTILGIIFYCIPSLIQLQLRQALSRPLLWRYVLVSVTASIVVLATSAWS